MNKPAQFIPDTFSRSDESEKNPIKIANISNNFCTIAAQTNISKGFTKHYLTS